MFHRPEICIVKCLKHFSEFSYSMGHLNVLFLPLKPKRIMLCKTYYLYTLIGAIQSNLALFTNNFIEISRLRESLLLYLLFILMVQLRIVSFVYFIIYYACELPTYWFNKFSLNNNLHRQIFLFYLGFILFFWNFEKDVKSRKNYFSQFFQMVVLFYIFLAKL